MKNVLLFCLLTFLVGFTSPTSIENWMTGFKQCLEDMVEKGKITPDQASKMLPIGKKIGEKMGRLGDESSAPSSGVFVTAYGFCLGAMEKAGKITREANTALFLEGIRKYSQKKHKIK